MSNEDSIIRRTAKKVQKHKKKAAGFSIATIIVILQVYGVIAPLVCDMPFIHDTQACLDSGKKALQAAKGLHQLDDLKLDDGSPFMVETVEPPVDPYEPQGDL